jgi:hypothetical protein
MGIYICIVHMQRLTIFENTFLVRNFISRGSCLFFLSLPRSPLYRRFVQTYNKVDEKYNKCLISFCLYTAVLVP